MAFLGQEEQLRDLQDRFKFLYIALGVFFVLLLSRLIFLQILQGDKMRRYSEENRIKRVLIAAPRGMIFDRNEMLLVDNRPAFDLEIVPQYLRESGQKQETISRLASLVSMSEKSIYRKLRRARGQPSFLPVKIKTDLTRDEVAKIQTWRIAMPGVSVAMEIQRTTVYGDVASHLLGYIAKINQRELPRLNRNRERKYRMGDTIGKSGIEKKFEKELRGTEGYELVEVDALGRRMRDSEAEGSTVVGQQREMDAQPGNNIRLTIDQDLQIIAKEAFANKAGGLVAMDPKNGEILAMISRPSFDPTDFSRGIPSQLWKSLLENPNRPLRDKTLQDHYPPGSVFKVFTALAGLEEGVITPTTKHLCNGSIRVGNRRYHCHSAGGHGEVDLVDAIKYSCDIFFYRLALKLKSVNQIAKWAKAFGLGSRTSIDLPREVPGLIPTEKWKEKRFGKPWTRGESLSVAIGQSFVLTTSLQLATAYSALVNGGVLYRPQFVESIEKFNGDPIKKFNPEVASRIEVSSDHLEVIKTGLFKVMNEIKGTGYWYRIPGAEMGGKTGTAQVVRLSADKIYQKCKEMKYEHRHHALFTGVAPMSDPSIVVSVIAEHQCAGSSGAAPIARAVIRKYLQKYRPEFLNPKRIAQK